MKSILLIMMMTATMLFAQADTTFFNQVKGKTITGQSIEKIETTFVFSADGKKVTLEKLGGKQHTFVKMVGDIAVYEGKRGGKVHYDAFQIKGKDIMLASSDQIGGIKLKPNTPEQIAKEFAKKSLKFSFK